MNPFEAEGEDYKGLDDSNFHLSRDMSLSNMLEHDREPPGRFSGSKIKPEEANISSIKQKIIDRDELLRELNKLRTANEDLTIENEKYKDEVVELRERLVQSTSAGNINKLHEQINHLKSLNEQLTQRVHNLEKELGGKEGNESDKKALKTLRKDLETKEEELATNRQLLESSYVTVQKYKEKLQKVNVATKSGRATTQNLSVVKIQHCNITSVEAMSVREVVAGDSAWHVKVIGLQEEVINLKNKVHELDVINYKQQLELMKYKTGQLKSGSLGDIGEDLTLYKGAGDVEDVIQKRVEELFKTKGKSLVQDFVDKQLGKKGREEVAEDDSKLRLGEEEEPLDWLNNFGEKEEEIKEEKKEVKKGKDPRKEKEKEKKEDKQKKEKKDGAAKKENRARDNSTEEVKKKVKTDAPSKENGVKENVITKENNLSQQKKMVVEEAPKVKEEKIPVPSMIIEKDVKPSQQQQTKPEKERVLKSNDPRRKISQSKDVIQPVPPVILQPPQVSVEKELEDIFRSDSKDEEKPEEVQRQAQTSNEESNKQKTDTGKIGQGMIEEEFMGFDDWGQEEDHKSGTEKMNVEQEKWHETPIDQGLAQHEEDKKEIKSLEDINREHPMQIEASVAQIPVTDQTLTNLDQTLIVEEPQAMVVEPIEPTETKAKTETIPEEVKEIVKAKEVEKVNLQALDKQIDEAIKEGRFSSRSELVENSFEAVMTLYLHKFEAAKYFDSNDQASSNRRRKLLEVLMNAINIEDLSEIAMKIIETFVKLSKKHQFSCLAFSFWAFLKDITSASSRSYVTSLNRLAGSLYNFLLLPYISKKQHEGQHTQLPDFTSLEKWRYLAFISNVLEVPLDGLDQDLAFGALLEFKDYDDIVSRHMEALNRLNVFTNNPLQVLLLVGILSIYKTCQKALPVLDILIDLVCYQTENQVSHCNLIFVTISSAWKFMRENLGLLSPHNNVEDGFTIDGSAFAYLFAFKFLPLSESYPSVYNLDLAFVVLRLAVLRIFSKLSENDAAQSIKLKLMINKLREKPNAALRDTYEEGFNQWLEDNLRIEKLSDQTWQVEKTVSVYKANNAPAVNIFYEFVKECLNQGLRAGNSLALPQDTDPREIQIENGVNVIDIVISLQVAGSIFTQTEWCDQLIEGALFKYIQTGEYRDSLQRILAVVGLGLFLANIESQECTERVNEVLVSVVTGAKEEYSMLDRMMAFVVLGTYNSDLLRENLGEVKIDDRLVEYLEGDIMDIYMSM